MVTEHLSFAPDETIPKEIDHSGKFELHVDDYSTVSELADEIHLAMIRNQDPEKEFILFVLKKEGKYVQLTIQSAIQLNYFLLDMGYRLDSNFNGLRVFQPA